MAAVAPAAEPARPPGIPAATLRLAERLEAAGVPRDTPPRDAWLLLHDVEGARATVIDLYALVATPRHLLPNELPAAERLELWWFAAPIVWPGFEVTEGSARRGDLIEVVEYDPSWPQLFLEWRAALRARLGEVANRIEHVGSTAVPGLAAKPRIDIQVSVTDLAAEDRYVPHLEAAGVQLRSRDDAHRYFRPFPGGPRVVQVHVCAVGSAWETDHLVFRDYLRSHVDARDAYAALKRENARVRADDGVGYPEAEGEIIMAYLELAREWDRNHRRRTTGPMAAT